jgi:hypothetical protein
LKRVAIALLLLVGFAGTASATLWWPFHASIPAPTINAYFSSSTGNDSNPCTIGNPCATVAKATSLTYGPNSTINFFAGDTFTTTTSLSLIGPGDTSKTQNVFGPLTIQSYGSGTCSVIAGTITGCATLQSSGSLSGVVFLDDLSNITVQNIRIVGGTTANLTYNTGYGLQLDNHAGFGSNWNVNNVEIIDFSLPLWGRVATGTVSGVTIEDNYIHGSNSTVTVDQAVLLQGLGNGTIQGNLVTNYNGRASGAVAGTSGNGILVSNLSYNWLDQFNVTHDGGSLTTICGGPVGNWDFETTNGTWQFNESYNNGPTGTPPGGGCDWDGFDIDGGSGYIVVQYNYAHNNTGYDYNLFQANSGGMRWQQNVVRYNIGEEVKGTRAVPADMFLIGGATNLKTGSLIYNNTYYTDSDIFTNSVGLCFWVNNDSDIKAFNNICMNGGATGKNPLMQYNPSAQTMLFKNNDWFRVNHNQSSNPMWNWHGCPSNACTTLAQWKAAGGDQSGLSVNPNLTSAGGGGTCYSSGVPAGPQPCPSAYVLQGGSPMIGTGLDLTAQPYQITVGSKDYYGNSIPNGVGTGYNVGADGGNP